ncbi:MAG: VWA domain-containing protein [Chloroflexota bacterium]
MLGGGEADGVQCSLGSGDASMDQLLAQLYDNDLAGSKDKQGGTGTSQPNISRWLGDIRNYFPTSVVQVMQQDAVDRVGIARLLTEPEILEMMEADVHLVASLISLNRVLPNETKATARLVVQRVVDELKRKLANPTQQAIIGTLNRAVRNNRPRHNEIDWERTIKANLKHYQPDYKTVIPERLVGFGRKRAALKDVILCIDQSGSMATSVVYSSIFGAVMASIGALKTHMVLFDTAVVDVTAELSDPVDLLFGAQLGGGTDIGLALGYCQQLIHRPQDTVLILISDLYEGGNVEIMVERATQLVNSGVQMVALLALSDDGAPSFSRHHAATFADLGIPSFACTPDQFPDLMATVLNRGNISSWAAKQEVSLIQSDG